MNVDMDLQFLQHCENDDLRALCDILLYDNRGKIRYSESLSNSDSYLKCYPNNMRDGQGPSYKRILRDVCKRMHVKDLDINDSVIDMEHKLLISVSASVVDKLSEEDIRSIMDECKMQGFEYTKQGLIAALMALRVINRRLFVIVIQTVMRMTIELLIGRGIAMAGMGIFSRCISVFFGPIGWLLLTGWTVWDLMGPAYRVTIPAVIQIAYMRVKYLSISNSK